MSRPNNVRDNSTLESFFPSLKTERMARKVYRTRNEARAEVFGYIESFCNRRRRYPIGRKVSSHRHVQDGTFWIAWTGAPRRALPEEFGKWASACRQFRRWPLAGLWEDILDATRTMRGLRPTSSR